MKKVAFWQPKGGVGKTTLALNTAACAATDLNIHVAVVCLDPQGSALMASASEDEHFKILDEVPSNESGWDMCILDYPANFWEKPEADIVVMPCRPTVRDYKTYAKARTYVEGLCRIPVVNMLDMRKKQQKEFAHKLRMQGACIVKDRASIEKASNDDLSIFHPSLERETRINEAKEEIRALLSHILRG